jgi:hypothetical protein
MSRFRPTFPTLAIALLACALLAGCGSSDEASAPAEAPPAAEPAPVTETPAPAPPPMAIEEGTLPDGFPDDIPIFPGSEPAASVSLGAAVPALTTFTTDASPADVLSFYEGAFAEKGWSVEVSDPDAGLIGGTKDGRKATIRTTPRSEGGTSIAVVLGS